VPEPAHPVRDAGPAPAPANGPGAMLKHSTASARADDPPAGPVQPGADKSVPPRILEIGGSALFARIYPETTARVWTNSHVDRSLEPHLTPWGWNNLVRAFRLARAGEIDLIVWHELPYAPWDPRYLFRIATKLGPLAVPLLIKYLATFAIVLAARRPLVVIDAGDYVCVPRHTMWVMGRAARTFKRELPFDRWRLLSGTLHPRQPTGRLRKSRRLKATLDRIRPISLGATWSPDPLLPRPAAEKRVDVFFAGNIAANSTVRDDGVGELEQLRARGYVIDIATERLSRAEFYDRCAASWLVWSPEGHGWECFRHYEVPLCGSVPLINRPPINRYAPLEHGVHCILYEVEPRGLARAVEAALADKTRLAEIAKAGHSFVLQHHTLERGCAYILAESGWSPRAAPATGEVPRAAGG